MHFRHCPACGVSLSVTDPALLRPAEREHARECPGSRVRLDWSHVLRISKPPLP